MDMLNKLVLIVVIVASAHTIIYHKKSGRQIAESQQNKVLPFKKASAKTHSIFQLVIGIIVLLFGILGLFGIIHIKGPF